MTVIRLLAKLILLAILMGIILYLVGNAPVPSFGHAQPIGLTTGELLLGAGCGAATLFVLLLLENLTPSRRNTR